MGDVSEGLEWVVGAVAPDAIAPHPNFSVDSANAAEVSALFASGRFREQDRYIKKMNASEAESRLISAIRDSLMLETQPTAAGQLALLAQESDLSIGARAAAALFASVALSELDRELEAVSLLSDFLSDGVASPEQAPNRLIGASIRQQLGLRLVESGDRLAGWNAFERVLADLHGSEPDIGLFDTSKGFNGGPKAASRLATATIKEHAEGALALMEPFGSKRWVPIVKRRGPRSDESAVNLEAAAGRAFVHRQFEAIGSGSRRRIIFGSGDSVASPLEGALIRAELSGDLGALGSRREYLGWARLLDRGGERTWSRSESLRLLRQSDSRESLQHAASAVRADGPVESLREEVRGVLDRLRSSDRLPTECDLLLLSAGAELLSERELGDAIELAHRFRGGEPNGRLTAPRLLRESAVEFSWRRIARFLPRSAAHRAVATELFASVQAADVERHRVLPALSQVVEEVDWSQVPEREKDAWRQWASLVSDDQLIDLTLAVLDKLDGVRPHATHVGRPTGLDLARRLLIEAAGGSDSDSAELSEACEACRSDMQRTIASADQGAYSYGRLNGAALATGLVLDLGQLDLWPDLMELLVHARISNDDKGPPFERLALSPDSIPTDLLPALEESAREALSSTNGRDPFVESDVPLFPSALRFLLGVRAGGRSDALPWLLRLSGVADVQSRRECVRSIGVLLAAEVPDWAETLLLQLSYDGDASVRGDAAFNIGRYGVTLSSIAKQRLGELLEEDSVDVPYLGVLGMIRGTGTIPEVWPIVERIAADPESAAALVDVASKLLQAVRTNPF